MIFSVIKPSIGCMPKFLHIFNLISFLKFTKMKKLIILIAIQVICTSIFAQLYKIPLENRVSNSSLIVEGTVIDKTSFQRNDEIYTSNLISITRTLKGNSNNKIKVITLGGELNGVKTEWSHLLSLEKGVKGIFFLTPTENSINEYEAYSSSQGFIELQQLNDKLIGIDPFETYQNITEVYTKIGYVPVNKSLIADPGKTCINFQLVPVSISGNKGNSQAVEIIADLLVKTDADTEPKLYIASTQIAYNPEFFGDEIIKSGNFQFQGLEIGANPNYELIISDITKNELEIKLKGKTENVEDLESLNTEYKKIGRIVFKIKDITKQPDFKDITASANNKFIPKKGGEIKSFDCVKTEIKGGVADCPEITSISTSVIGSLNVAAGVGTVSENGIPGVITIVGKNFTNPATGKKIPDGYTVRFLNAGQKDSKYVQPFEGDYISWADTKIEVKVPSIGYTDCERTTIGQDSYAGTGPVLVEKCTFFGNCYGKSKDEIYVKFAAKNTSQINAANLRESVKSKFANRDDDGGYSFYFDTNFKAYLGAADAFKRALTTWRCQTLVNYDIRELSTIPNVAGSCKISLGTLPAGTSSSTRATTVVDPFDCGASPNIQYSYLPATRITFRDKKEDGTLIDWHTSNTTPTLDWDSKLDLETIALHELGHAMLLRHTANTNNVMYYAASGYKRTLTTDDLDGGKHTVELGTKVVTACPNTAMTKISTAGCGLTSSEEISTIKSLIKVFPNPTDGFINISSLSENLDILSFHILSILGVELVKFDMKDTNMSLDISFLPSGMYILSGKQKNGEPIYVSYISKI